MVRPTINSEKHIVQQSTQLVAGGGVFNMEILDVVQNPTSTNEVRIGSVIKAVFVELWLNGQDAENYPSFTFTVEKTSSGAAQPTFSNMLNLHAYENKKNVLFVSQGIIGSKDSAQSVPIHRAWIAIPKGKQRFGQGDKLWVNLSCISDIQVCGVNIYKEYF